METMQQSLNRLYLSTLENEKVSPQLAARLSCPLTMAVTPEWEASPTRLLIVGQETLGNGLFGADAVGIASQDISNFGQLVALPNVAEAIDRLVCVYRTSMTGDGAHENRPFWLAFNKLWDLPGFKSALWSNLFWCALDGGSVWKNSTWPEFDEILQMQRGRLQREIELLKPTAVVFFTGPIYDTALKQEFEDAQLLAVDDLPERGFARVVSHSLPEASFRLYHPKALRMRGHWGWLDTLAQRLLAEQKQERV
jgi:hypothetical protein